MITNNSSDVTATLTLQLLHVTLGGVNQRAGRLGACCCVIMQAVSVLQCAVSATQSSRQIDGPDREPEPVSQEQAGVRFYESVYLSDTVDSALL